MAAVLLSSGTKGKRMILASKSYDPSATRWSICRASDIEIHTKEILYLRDKLNKILSKNTGQSIKTIEKDTTETTLCHQKKHYLMVSLTKLLNQK